MMQPSRRNSAFYFVAIIKQSLAIAENSSKQTSEQNFAVVADLEDEIKIEVDFAPYIVVSVKQRKDVVFHAFEVNDHGFSIRIFRKGDWIAKLHEKFEDIKKSTHHDGSEGYES